MPDDGIAAEFGAKSYGDDVQGLRVRFWSELDWKQASSAVCLSFLIAASGVRIQNCRA